MDAEKFMKTDVLIIGTGIAGCSAALRLASRGNIKILLVTKDKDICNSATTHAQGGIVARGVNDSSEKLKRDILIAGDGICNEKAVDILAEEGPSLVEELLIDRAGVRFNRTEGKLDYTREAAHSENRILFNNDHTGEEIETKITAAVLEEKNIDVLCDHTLVDLLVFPEDAADKREVYKKRRCVGAELLDNENAAVIKVLAKKVILATGGIGQVYRRTVNPEVATGDGVAAAHRAGASIVNAEYVQFHPTSLYCSKLNNFLISESVRGEGAQLKNEQGECFMDRLDPRGSLAPRDIVARGVYEEMSKGNSGCVYLDLKSYMDAECIKERFPLIYATCLEQGIDITCEMIPIAPTAHYFCGGVKVDEDGRTNIENLYAAGEVSCTGLHGANRLASTSLLEGLVWGSRTANDIASKLLESELVSESEVQLAPRDIGKEYNPALVKQDWASIKSIMWNCVGIVRKSAELERAVADLEYLQKQIGRFYAEARLTREIIELRNGVETAMIIARAARDNEESKGCHFRRD